MVPQLSPGDSFERYRIEAFLGRGGMGEVYRALDTRLKRIVALKLLRRDDGRAPDADEGRRILSEARALAALSHPNVVTVYDVSQHEGIPYLTMELLEGQSLRGRGGMGAGNVAERVGWLGQIASALAAAHRAGLVHRDVKPDNVMLTAAGTIKLLDFGIARRVDAQAGATASGGAAYTVNPNATATGALVGTPKYMSPEQRAGLRADARSDQYAWGLVAHELFTGTLPAGDPQLLDRAGVPRAIAVVVMRALATRPDDRFASMDEIVAAFGVAEPLAAQRSPASTHSPTAPTLQPALQPALPAARPRQSGRGLRIALWVLGPVVLLLALALAAVALIYFKTRAEPSPATTAAPANASVEPPLPDTATATSADARTATAASVSAAPVLRPSVNRSRDASAPIADAGGAASADAGASKLPTVPHRVSVSAISQSNHLPPAVVSQHVAALKPQIASCYRLPFCLPGQGARCLFEEDKQRTWTLFFEESGKLHNMHTAGSFQINSCVSGALEAIEPFSPFTRGLREGYPSIEVTVTVED